MATSFGVAIFYCVYMLLIFGILAIIWTDDDCAQVANHFYFDHKANLLMLLQRCFDNKLLQL